MTRGDQLSFALNEFLSVSPDVEAAAVVSIDGLPMASALPDTIEEDRLAAMSAALLTLGERAAAGLNKGSLAQVFVEGEHGNVVLMAAGDYAVLVAMTSRRAKAGLVLFEMRRIAARIAEVLDAIESLQAPVVATPEEVATESPYDFPPVAEAAPSQPSTWHEPVQPTPEWEPTPASDPQESTWGEQSGGAEQPQEQEQWSGDQSHEPRPEWAEGSGDQGSPWERRPEENESPEQNRESQENESPRHTWG